MMPQVSDKPVTICTGRPPTRRSADAAPPDCFSQASSHQQTSVSVRCNQCRSPPAAPLGTLPFAQGGQETGPATTEITDIVETTLEEFTQATGITVRYDLFASNEEKVSAKLREGNPGLLDAIFPSNVVVASDDRGRYAIAVYHSKIPNIGNIDPAFADPAFDPGLK